MGSIPPVGLAAGDDLTFEVPSYFSDPDGDALSYAAESTDASVATASVSGSTVTITGVAAGSATVTVTARDPAGLTAVQNVAVTVERANRAPEAVGSIPPVGLAAGDDLTFDVPSYFSDPDGDALSYAAESTDASVATASVSGSTVTITGVAAGSATVTVTARDPAGLTAVQNVAVTVERANRAPEAVGSIPPVGLAAGDDLTFEVPSYFSDPDGDALSYAAESTDASVATASVSGSTVTITAVAAGTATVTVTARDPGALTASQTVDVTVSDGSNRAPEGTLPFLDVTIPAGVTITFNVFSYFFDPDGDRLSYSGRTSNPDVTAVAVSGSALSLTGVAEGQATVAVTARDPGNLPATLSFGVNVANGPPAAVGEIPEDTLETGETAAVDLSGYFTDPDGDSLAYTATASFERIARVSVSGSTMTIEGVAEGNTTITVTASDPDGNEATQRTRVTVRLPNQPPVSRGTIPDLTLTGGRTRSVYLGSYFDDRDALTYSAATSDAAVATVAVTGNRATVTGVGRGTAEITVTARDPGGLEASQRFTATVPNNAPQETATVPGDTLDVGATVTLDLSEHFTDPDGDALSFTAEPFFEHVATATVSGSTLTIVGVGEGSTSVTITARDPAGLEASQRPRVRVRQPNRPPAATRTIPDVTVEAGRTDRESMYFYFDDPDRDALTYTAVSSDEAVASVTVSGRSVTVEGVSRGTARITVTARDPEGLEAQQSFTVTVPNSAPEAVGDIPYDTVDVGETTTVELSGYFTDPDGDPLTYTADVFFESRARATVAGSVMTVEGLEDGRTSITVTARDPDGMEDSQRTYLTVIQPNRPPTIRDAIPGQTVELGDTESLSMFFYFEDPDRDDLTYLAETSNPAVATVSTSGRRVVIAAVAKGTARITIVARDPGGLEARQSFGVTVPNSEPEEVGSLPEFTLNVGETFSVDLHPYFTDPDGDPLTYTAEVFFDDRAGVTISGTVMTVEGLEDGGTSITVTARDPEGEEARQRTRVEVIQPNRPPESTDVIPDQTLEPGEDYWFLAFAYFDDPDRDRLTYSATTSNASVATVTVSGSRVTIDAVAEGTATITVRASDPDGLAAEQDVAVTVQSEQGNQAPTSVGTIGAQTIDAGNSVTIDVSSSFRDPDDDRLTYSATTSNASVATATVSASRVTISAAAGGTATITVTARDPGGLSARQRIRVTVPNGAPTGRSIPAQVISAGETAEVSLSSYFSDPDGDRLTYRGSSNDTGVATASVVGSTLTIRPVAAGANTVTVTARDPGGLAASQDVAVTVQPRANRPPSGVTIPAQTLTEAGSVTLDLSSYFSDPDGDPLMYAGSSDSDGVATAGVIGNTLTIRAVTSGTATVTATAADPGGLAATQGIAVSVARPDNQPPEPTGTIPDETLNADESVTVQLSSYFDDPDADALTYTSTVSQTGVATASVSGSSVTVTGVARGTATVTITGRDLGGLEATQAFDVTVRNSAPEEMGAIPATTIAVNASATIDASSYFRDRDGDQLSYAAESAAAAVASAAVSGSTVTISGVATGTAVVTITTRDPGGLEARQRADVTVRATNRAPEAAGTIPAQTLEAGSSGSIDVMSYFSDPDDDALMYASATSDAAVATASVSGSVVTISAVSPGAATVTVTASDPGGAAVTQEVSVEVQQGNRPPQTSGTIPGRTIEAGEAVTLDVSSYFTDPDSDALTFAASSSNSGVATASRVDSEVTISGQAPGTATVTVTASDADGASARQEIAVTVTGRRNNRPPESRGDIPAFFLTAGESAEVDMSPYFSDPDGDALTYNAATSAADAVTASASDGTLTLTAGTRGTATLTVTSADPGGLEAESSFSVAVVEADIGSYDIDLISITPMTESRAAAYRNAAEKWMRVLADTELPDMPVGAEIPVGCWGEISDRRVDRVDDLLLVVGVGTFDNPRTIAAAGSCRWRADSLLPWMGSVKFSVNYLSEIEADGGLEEVILHEMGHTLGISRFYWRRFDLLANPTLTWFIFTWAHSPGEDAHFIGPLAAEAFDEAGGTNYTGGDKVPLENCKGSGSGDSHWRELYWSEEVGDSNCREGDILLGGELMSPTYNRGMRSPLSNITIQALADMGYTVDASEAESYSLPEPGAERADPERMLDYGDDVFKGPITLHDRNGRIVRLIRNE
ncbi:Ig-like domain-containing protein [Candidatus Palauibacter sp.]|uniref:Ig-like domain-containing protein n=1 Tax=Candidatus Palauibacter sp. TaxID=3101350 RepID=UPI003B59A5E1